MAEEMRAAIAAIEVEMPGDVLTTTASFGYATLDEVEGSIDDLIGLADKRLYAAKRAGRNQVFYPQAHAA